LEKIANDKQEANSTTGIFLSRPLPLGIYLAGHKLIFFDSSTDVPTNTHTHTHTHTSTHILACMHICLSLAQAKYTQESVSSVNSFSPQAGQ